MDKKDYGFYGKGLDGYVHYKQSFDRIGKKSADASSGGHGESSGGLNLSLWQILGLDFLLFGLLYLLSQVL